jgi:hypothetical protein
MKPITRYQADDGSIWETPEEATARDRLLAAIPEATAPLGPAPDDERMGDGAGYRRHAPSDVLEVRRRLIALAREEFPDFAASNPEWFDPDEHPAWSFLGRVLGDGVSPLFAAWRRLMCTDDAGREWIQPYYVSRPNPQAVAVD